MTEGNARLEAEAKAVMKAYELLNRNDVSGFITIFDPAIEWSLPTEWPGGRNVSGVRRGVSTAEKRRERAGPRERASRRDHDVVGDRILLYAHVHVRLKTETEYRDGDIVDVFTFRNGKAIQICTFGDAEAAIKYAEAGTSSVG